MITQETVLLIVVGVGAAVAILAFVLAWRGQTLHNKQFDKMLDSHSEVIEHLEIAANPEAWIARKAEEHRRERREAEKQAPLAGDDGAEESKGVF